MQEVPNVSRLVAPGHCMYSSVSGSAACVLPDGLSRSIVGSASDTCFSAVFLSCGVALFSVYLPDSSKSDTLYEAALAQLSLGIQVALMRRGIRHIVLVGDFNAVFRRPAADALASEVAVFGPNLPDEIPRRFSERLELIRAFCIQHDLLHGPSCLSTPWVDLWTHQGWRQGASQSTLDHVFLSSALSLSRWAPWSADSWTQQRHKLWGDHRPILWSVQSAVEPLRLPNQGSSRGNLKGWRPANRDARDLALSRMHDWAIVMLKDVLATVPETRGSARDETPLDDLRPLAYSSLPNAGPPRMDVVPPAARAENMATAQCFDIRDSSRANFPPLHTAKVQQNPRGGVENTARVDKNPPEFCHRPVDPAVPCGTKGGKCQDEFGFTVIQGHSWGKGPRVEAPQFPTAASQSLARSLSDRLVQCVRFPSPATISHAISSTCASVPHNVARQSVPAPSLHSERLRELRCQRLSLDRGSDALRANRRETARLKRARESLRFAAEGGLRKRRFVESWRSLSFIQFRQDGPFSSDREVWRDELVSHWTLRFGDVCDSAAAQMEFAALLASDATDGYFQPSLGEVVLAMSGARAGSSGGLDQVAPEMLHCLPWALVLLLHGLFAERFRSILQRSREQDAWKTYLATWIRKDKETDLLTSFRPIVQSSVMLKWLERLCLGYRPEQSLLPCCPLWGFRPYLSAALLALTAQLAIHVSLAFTVEDVEYHEGSRGQGAEPHILVFVDVEKAFDKMRLPHQRRCLRSMGLPASRVCAYLSEQLHSQIFARLGDVEVGPLTHTRGKQGGCGTPFAFNAMMCSVLARPFASWVRRGFGIRLRASADGPLDSAPLFCAGIFADNLVLAGTCSAVQQMYREATEAISSVDLRWKPSSYSAFGPAGLEVSLPPCGGHAASTLRCVQKQTWLGFTLSYEETWTVQANAAFDAAHAAWHANRKVLYSRRLALRLRLQVFAQTVVSILLARLALLPLTVSIVQRVRRFEARFLRAMTGWQRPASSLAEFADFTRKARKIAASCGHTDMSSALLCRVFDQAGRWARLAEQPSDVALGDFRNAWRTSLEGAWLSLHGHGVRRARRGRPPSAWDLQLSLWSRGRWMTWARTSHGWSELRSLFVQWMSRKSGFANETFARGCLAAPVILRVNTGPRRLLPSNHAHVTCFHVFSDSEIVATVCQGRSAPRQSYLADLCRRANDLVACLPLSLGHDPAHWWISHVSRTENCWSDSMAKLARRLGLSCCFLVHDTALWHAWCTVGFSGSASFFVTGDGSTAAENPCPCGPSGASSTLWSGCRPVATALSAHSWAVATSAEVAAVQLAFCLLAATPFSLYSGFRLGFASVLALAGFDAWLTVPVLRQSLAEVRVCSAARLAHIVGLRASELAAFDESFCAADLRENLSPGAATFGSFVLPSLPVLASPATVLGSLDAGR